MRSSGGRAPCSVAASGRAFFAPSLPSPPCGLVPTSTFCCYSCAPMPMTGQQEGSGSTGMGLPLSRRRQEASIGTYSRKPPLIHSSSIKVCSGSAASGNLDRRPSIVSFWAIRNKSRSNDDLQTMSRRFSQFLRFRDEIHLLDKGDPLYTQGSKPLLFAQCPALCVVLRRRASA